MSYQPKLLAPQYEYIKALIWFRGGTTQDNTDYFNLNKTTSTGCRLLNAYLDRYNQYTKGAKS